MPLRIYAETKLPTEYGSFRVRVYRDEEPARFDNEPLAILSGRFDHRAVVNVRIHSSCMTSEVLGSCKCDCKHQLDQSLVYISEHTGVLIYLHQEGRGIGLGNKLRAYALQDHGYDTIEANEMLGLPVDARTYDHAIDILRDLQIGSVNLLTNNPKKISALEDAGIHTRRIPLLSPSNRHSASYLETKRTKMGHLT